MPGMDGIEVAEAIAGAPALRSARLVMLTSTGDRRARARAAGIEHYLTKPVRRARLLEAVAEAMGSAPRERVAATDSGSAAAAPKDANLLVVEDNAVNQLVIEGMLARRGFGVDCAANGRQTLAMLAEREYALGFMHCQLPELEGSATTAEIRAGEAGGDRRLPIVAMTAHA